MFTLVAIKTLLTCAAYAGWVLYVTKPLYCKGCKEELLSMKCSACGRKRRSV